VGQRVSGEGHLVGMRSRMSRAGRFHLDPETKGIGVNVPGAFAEYLRLPAFNVVALPDDIDDDLGAILDPLGNAVHTALSFDLVGEDVLITGAGPIGCMAVAIARHVGARHVVITDVNEYRLELARKMGATLAVNVQHTTLSDVMKDLGMTEGFDVGMEMSGNGEALRKMLERMNHGGRVAILGIPPTEVSIDWNQVIFKGLVIKGIYGREMFETWYKMASMLTSGLDVSPVLTHRFGADRFADAFEAMKTGHSGKVVLEWAG
jgi:threonine 3-dehydrogenase